MNALQTIVLSLPLLCIIAVANNTLARASITSPASQVASSAPTDHFAHIKAAHRLTVEKWLAGKPGWRPAIESDCKNTSGVESLRSGDDSKHLHPYYVVGDMNGDRKEDFAIVIYHPRKRADSRFSIAIFNGSGQGTGATPAYFVADVDLRQGGIWVSPVTETTSWLAAGEFETDNGSYFKPRGRTYVAVDMAGGN